MLWLFFDFIGVNASGNYFGHQIKQLLPVFSIIVAISIYSFFNVNKERIQAKAALFVIIISIVCFPYRQIYNNIKLVLKYNNTSIKPHYEIANWIQENSKSNDYIYIIGGEPNLIRTQAIVKRTSSSKYFQSIFLTSDYERKILMKDLKQNLPVFILRDQFINKDIFDKYGNAVRNFVDDNYLLVKTIHNVEILEQR